MAAAQQLARAAMMWSCLRKESASAALLRYGIPDFKMEKHLIDRRMEQMEAEGVNSARTSISAWTSRLLTWLQNLMQLPLPAAQNSRAILPVTGRELDGVHFAMEFLPQQNKRNAGDTIPDDISIRATARTCW